MFNGGIRGRRAKDGQGTVSSQAQFLQQQDPAPSITGYSISGSDDTQLDPAGGQTVIVSGYGFKSGLTGIIGSTAISAVTVISATRVSFTSTAQSPGSYTLTLANSNGQAAILVPGLTYSSIPTFTTAAGSIGTSYETTAIDTEVVATSDSAITYTLASGSLPSGATLASDGTITGTSPVETGSTTYSFAITATDAELQDVTRSFTLTVNTDVVTWVTPSNGATITNDGIAYSQELSATDAAGYAVSYTANALPTGLTLSSGTISGSPSVSGTTTTLLTATAATTNRSATNTITWVVSLGDIYWKNVSLLLSGSTPTTTFINDASLNNSQLTIAGDARPNNFNPYTEGYYSNYIDGTGDYLSAPTNAAFSYGTGDFTIETWIYLLSYPVLGVYGYICGAGASGQQDQFIITPVTGVFYYYDGGATYPTSSTAIPLNTWTHVVACRSSGTLRLFMNGVLVGSGASSTNITIGATNAFYIGNRSGAGDSPQQTFNGYLSNLRVVKGTGLYTSAFTPITTPLTAVVNTSLLTCQSNRLIDNSPRNVTITKGGDTTVNPTHPFAIPTTVAYNTQYSTQFDGTGDYLSAPANAAFAFGTGDYTLEFWLYPTIALSSTRCFYNNNSGGYFFQWASGSGLQTGVAGSSATGTYSASITTSTWTHVAISRSSGSSKCFLNGTQTGTTLTDNTNYTQNGAFIGALYEGSQAFTGYISNLRVIKGTALYTTTFTPSTTPLTAVSGTSLLTCQSATLIDNSTNAFAITSYGQSQPIVVSPFTMTTSNTTVTSLGSTYFFDQGATTDYLTLPNTPALNLSSGDFTIEAWVYRNELTTNLGTIISKDGRPTISYNSYQFSLSFPSSFYALTFRTGNGNTATAPQSIVSTVALPLYQWVHAAVVKSGSTITIYQNGVNVVSATQTTAIVDGGQPIYIGMDQGQANTSNWSGYISDLHVVKGTALYTSNFLPPQAPLAPVTNTQLLTCQYNSGANNNSFVDQSSFNNIVTRTGNTTQGTFSPFSQNGWSNYFDGTGDYLSWSGTTLASDFTVECWVYKTAVDASGYTNVFAGTSNQQFAIDNTTAGSIQLVLNGTLVIPPSGTSVTLNQWHHLAWVRQGSTCRAYVNGVQQGTGTNSGGFTLTLIGTYQLGGFEMNGYISNARIVNGTCLYPSGTTFTPSTTPLTAVANTALLTCQDNRLIDNSANNFTLTKNGDVSVQAYSPFGGVTSVPTSYSNYFDGTDTLRAPYNSTAFTFGTNNLTIECWIYNGSLTNAGVVGQAQNNGQAGQSIGLFIVGSGTIGWYAAASSGSYTVTITGNVPLNQWNHVAGTRSGNTWTLWINGVSAGTATWAGTVSQGATGSYGGIDIGHLLGSYPYTGYISNVRVVNGTALYTTSFTPSTTPLTAVANTVLLTSQSNTLVDNSTNKFALTAVGDTKPRPFNPFGTTTTTGMSYSPSVNSGSMYLDGTGDNLYAPAIPKYSTSEHTIEFWVYFNNVSSRQCILTQGWSTGSYATEGGWTLDIGTYAGGLSFALGTMASGAYWLGNASGLGSFTTNQWYHIAIVRSAATTVTIFSNGVSIATGTLTSNTTIMSNMGILRIGAYDNNTFPLNGYITAVRISRGALYTSSFYPGPAPLTPTTTIGTTTYTAGILLNGTSGGIIDYHGTNNLETVGNTQLASEDPYGGSYYSNYFDGTGDYLSLPSSSNLLLGTGDFTIEYWVNVTQSSPTNESYVCHFSYGITGNVLRVFSFYTTAAGWQHDVWIGGSNIVRVVNSSGINGWAHVALVRSGTTLTSYINGVSINSVTAGTDFNTGTLDIGRSSTLYMMGYISNFRVIKGTALYTSAFTPSTTTLTAVSGTSLLTCQSNTFKDNSTNNFTITRNGDTKVKSMNPFQQNTGKSLYFDGTGDYLLMPTNALNNFGSGDFTVEAWVYPNSLAGDWFIASATGTGGFFFGFASTTTVGFGWGRAGTAWDYRVAGNATVGVWQYVAVTRSGTSMRLFVNGTQSGTTQTLSTAYDLSLTSTTIGSQGANYYLNGYIKDLRITKGVARYTTTFTPPTTPMQTK